MSESAPASDRDTAAAPKHRHRGGEPAAIRIGLQAISDPMQLIGVPADFEHAVQGLEFDQFAEDATHSVADLVCGHGLGAPAKECVSGIRGGDGGPAEGDDIAFAGVDRCFHGGTRAEAAADRQRNPWICTPSKPAASHTAALVANRSMMSSISAGVSSRGVGEPGMPTGTALGATGV